MTQKVKADLNASLVRKAKREALRQGKELSQILEEALDRYLIERGPPRVGVVASSWGAIKADAETVRRSGDLRTTHGLVVNDSLLCASALGSGVTALASADRDFERVGEIQLYRPGDVG